MSRISKGNPGLSVWDVPSSPSKKAVKRKHDDMAKQHEDPGEAALPSSSHLPTPTPTTSSPAERKAVDTAPTSPAPSPAGSEPPRGAPRMSNAPPRYEPVEKKARKADDAAKGKGKGKGKGKTEGKTEPEPRPETKTGSNPPPPPPRHPKSSPR